MIVPNRFMSATALVSAILAGASLLIAIYASESRDRGPALAGLCRRTSGMGVLAALTFGGCALLEQRSLVAVAAIALALGVGLSLSAVMAAVDRSTPHWLQEAEVLTGPDSWISRY